MANTPGDGTAKLMQYWAEGAGAGKIAWGSPGDFDRCRVHLGKYVQGSELDGLCANLHHRATGTWPGSGSSNAHASKLTG
jgi:hypothetical protein